MIFKAEGNIKILEVYVCLYVLRNFTNQPFSRNHFGAHRPKPNLAKITSFNVTVERFLRVDSARRFMSGQSVSTREREREKEEMEVGKKSKLDPPRIV